LGQEWEIYRETGDEEAGFEYPTDAGRIDILARIRVGQNGCSGTQERSEHGSGDWTDSALYGLGEKRI